MLTGPSLHGAPVGRAGHLSSAGSGYAGSLQLRSGSSSEHRRLSLDGQSFPVERGGGNPFRLPRPVGQHAYLQHRPRTHQGFLQGRPASCPGCRPSTYAAKVFSDFARFPWITRRDRPRGYRVELRDLRFLSATRRRQAFVVGVELDLEFSVLEEVFSFSGPPKRRQPRSRPGNSNPLLRGEEGRTISSNHPVTQHHDPHDHQRNPSKVIPKIRLSLFPVTRTQIGDGPES